ncbi:hypothetical protein [Amycolatopsis sp. CA-128772]|uniref:hypothetical protein n=1 Tax=Amycolatopsis sp. CA-128772 TaxID=2073159 RepID=UPI000CD31A5F|nr:hypothetical protein [Amycolatopsis sp. CA-128772]
MTGSPPAARDLARQGELAGYAALASEGERKLLRADLYGIVQPVVFGQLTKKLELNRGHFRCATAVSSLADECLDRFHDDMDAVLDDLFRNVRVPVHNLEGWVRTRLTAVTVDAYRRRRGARGALQRPRVPAWLAMKLGGRQSLLELAVDMLEFAGHEVAAGAGIWPVGTWAARRAMRTGGDFEAARRAVERDVDAVVAAMRSRPRWFDDYVERPLGRKRIPLPPAAPPELGEPADPARHQAAEAVLTELAGVAVTAIGTRLARGEDARTVVVDVVRAVFEEPADARIAALADRASTDRLVAAVLAIVAGRGSAHGRRTAS